MNKITATGRIVADAETRHTPNGDPVTSFRLASDVGFGDKKMTNWFQCQLWGKRAESLAQYLTKGTPVTVFGMLTLRPWENKEGQKQISPDIRIDEIELHGGRPEAKPEQSAPQRSAQGAQPDYSDAEDVPF